MRGEFWRGLLGLGMAGKARHGKARQGMARQGMARRGRYGRKENSMTYQWKVAGFHKVSADVAGAVCEKLEAEGNLTAKALVDASRPEDAPLHSEFEWSDDVAAEKWREQQGRLIINQLTVVFDNQEPVRKFFNIEKATPTYSSIDVILKNEDTKEQLLQLALKELNAFKRKYSQLTELSKLFDAISEAEEALENAS